MSTTQAGPLARIIGSPRRNSVGAVVLGGDYHGLGIVRALGRRGVPVFVIDDEHSIARFSRYCTRFVRCASLRNGDAIISTLLELGKQLNLHGWVLYPTRDEHVAALSRYRAELVEMFRVPTPSWETVKWAWDKRNTHQLAQELGIPTARTFYFNDVEQLAELDHCEPPFAIKPAIKEHFIYATKAKAWCANSHAELKTMFRKASELVGTREVMVQEVIPGGGAQQFSYCAFFRDGNAVGKMVACRRRQHPLQFGRASTYVESVEAPIIEELSDRFLRAINYYGLVEMEYKFDLRVSQYKLLDVNARTWGHHSLGAYAGVDFSYMLYADQLGLPVGACRAETGVRWVRMTTDVASSMMAILAGELKVKDYFRSLQSCHTEAVFSREDPLPTIAEFLLLPYLMVKRGF